MLSSVLAPPPSLASNALPDWQRLLEWITIMSQNIMSAANDLRPVQVGVEKQFLRFKLTAPQGERESRDLDEATA